MGYGFIFIIKLLHANCNPFAFLKQDIRGGKKSHMYFTENFGKGENKENLHFKIVHASVFAMKYILKD